MTLINIIVARRAIRPAENQKPLSYLCLEDFKLLHHRVVHAQLGVPHQHAVPVLAADAVREVAQVLLHDGHQQLLAVGGALGRREGLGHGAQLGAHFVQLPFYNLFHGNLRKRVQCAEVRSRKPNHAEAVGKASTPLS
jgi:hypothetical protein